jgi:hypothetical protein
LDPFKILAVAPDPYVNVFDRYGLDMFTVGAAAHDQILDRSTVQIP